MSPRRRVPLVTLERVHTGQVLRHARGQETADGAEDDLGGHSALSSSSSSLPLLFLRARLLRGRGRSDDVLEHDGVRLRLCIPRRAHDLRPEARVRAQAARRPQFLPVRAYLWLPGVVRVPARIRRARE